MSLVARAMTSFAIFISLSAHAARYDFALIQGKNYYEFLGVSPTASRAEIAAAFKKLMKIYHPDAGTTKNTELAAMLNVVNDTFNDDGERATYDYWLRTTSQGQADSAQRDREHDRERERDSEEEHRKNELKKNANYVINEALNIRLRNPEASLSEMAWQGSSFVIYAMRYMPGSSYRTEELWQLLTVYGQGNYENNFIGVDSFVALAGGTLHYLIENARYGSLGNEQVYLDRFAAILRTKLYAYPYDQQRRKPWEALWKIIYPRSSAYPPEAASVPLNKSNCEDTLKTTARFVHEGVTYEIPITISVKIGF